MEYKILLAGDGGQGIQLLSELICRSAWSAGWEISHLPNYGLEQRGGSSLAFIKIADEKISYPKFSVPDLLLLMSEQARQRTRAFQVAGTGLIDYQEYQAELQAKKIPALGMNLFFLGLISQILESKGMIKLEELKGFIQEKLASKPGWVENQQAFQAGCDYNFKL
ncbi:MAG TPA: 2-oxoacid:acceptor oxidoreductase family protein [Patescibacteria group bacterium]|nr:2-oxoacid:acceptor oxidoreductase family protein [Patescibacteria group bacterium]